MAKVVASAVIGETLSRVSTFVIDEHGKNSGTDDIDIDRLEMAHVKLEAALQLSNRWQISDVPLLRWRSKLKRAAEECDQTLRHHKQRALEDEEKRQGVRQSSFPKRMAHAAMSFVASFTSGRSNDESVNVRRFERYADGAGEFLKFAEFGAAQRQYVFFNPLIGPLLAGKTLKYQVIQGSQFYYFGIRPMSFADRGVEAMAGFSMQDFKKPAKSFNLGFLLRLSESTDILGVIAKCMQSVTPHFKIAAEEIMGKLVGLPTQDFAWYDDEEYWVDIHTTLSQWFRPNPLCCNGHDQGLITSRTNTTNVWPEQVITLHLQCHISLSGHGQTSSLSSGFPPLKLSVLFIPHDGSPQDIAPADENYALEVIDEIEQERVYTNACLQEVDEKLLPKAIDHLHQNEESKMYQMCLRSRHGTTHLCVEKMNAQFKTARRSKTARSRTQARIKTVDDQKREKYSKERWQKVSKELLNLWVVRASDKIHGALKSLVTINSA